MAHFERLELNNWRQFEAIDIRFGTPTTVVTGANGCGKTSILTVLGHHFGWNLQFVSTPYVSRRTRRLLYSEFRKRDALKMERESIASIPEDVDESATPDQGPQSVGAITYSDGRSCDLRTPSKIATNPQYHLQYSAAQSIEGLYIPSYARPPPTTRFLQHQRIQRQPRSSIRSINNFSCRASVVLAFKQSRAIPGQIANCACCVRLRQRRSHREH
ncbi:MAG: AAA family ATPase [Proteobacteria bacterium]|nr:AAA family ATPase [Pseudomonadota bacterium]